MEDGKIYYSPVQMMEQGSGKYFQMREDGSLEIASNKMEAFYVSDVIDSGQMQMEWDSMQLQVSPKANMEIYIWILDDEELVKTWKSLEFDDRYYVLLVEGTKAMNTDILLYDQTGMKKGRYLCFAVHMLQSIQKDVCWYGYEVRFPKVCFSRYLPAIYHGNAVLNRYLAIFKELYMGMERTIDTFDQELNPWTTSKLNELSEWLDLGIYMQELSNDKKRAFFKLYRSLRLRKGTKYYYEEMLKFLYDEELQLDVKGNIVYVTSCKHVEQVHKFLGRELPCYMEYEIHERKKELRTAVSGKDDLRSENVML